MARHFQLEKIMCMGRVFGASFLNRFSDRQEKLDMAGKGV